LKSVIDAAEGAAPQDSAQLLLTSLLVLAITAVSTSSGEKEVASVASGLEATAELFDLWKESVTHNYQLEVE